MIIIEAIKRVLHENGTPMTTQEIFNAIVAKGLYSFHAQDPYGVVKNQIRRHCEGLDFPSASQTKHFKLLEGNKYFPLERTVKGRRTNKRKRSNTISVPKSFTENLLQVLKKSHAVHKDMVKKSILSDLKKMSPHNFEIFAKKLLDQYGFLDMEVTRLNRNSVFRYA
jgi:restriction system protein